MKKLIALAMAFVSTFAVAACEENGENGENDYDTNELQEAFDRVDDADSLTISMTMDTPVMTFEVTSEIDGDKEYSYGMGPEYYAYIDGDSRYIIEQENGEWIRTEDENYVPADEDLETDDLNPEWFTKDGNLFTLKEDYYEEVFGEGDTSSVETYQIEILENGLIISMEMITDEGLSTTTMKFTHLNDTEVELPDYEDATD